jgi:hypothetical protein
MWYSHLIKIRHPFLRHLVFARTSRAFSETGGRTVCIQAEGSNVEAPVLVGLSDDAVFDRLPMKQARTEKVRRMPGSLFA